LATTTTTPFEPCSIPPITAISSPGYVDPISVVAKQALLPLLIIPDPQGRSCGPGPLFAVPRRREIYQRGHFGRVPQKITIHKNTEFKEEEILGALDSFRQGTEVELVQIVKDVGWKGIRFDSKSPPSPYNYPIERGTYIPMDTNEALFWTQGSVLGVNVTNPSYNVYKEGALKPTPSPILLRRFSGDGGWLETCAGILGLTKMDWNNNTLYKKLPVTLVYSKAFADIIQQNPYMTDSVYDFRNFM
jgi:hypothetical protein